MEISPVPRDEQERYAQGNIPRDLSETVLEALHRLDEERLAREALLRAIAENKKAEEAGDIWA